MQTPRRTRLAGTAALAALGLALAACGSDNSSSPTATGSSSTTTTDWATAQSAEAGGGMEALVAAAQKEGTLNVIALPPTWANYAEIISTFKKKYGIKVNSENPDGASADEINALKSTKGQSSAPDVVDVGNSFALSGAQDGLYAPYKVATWNDIPDGQKDTGGLWTSDYGGYISIGCNATKVGTCPKTIKELDNPAYKNMVALNGDPTESNSAFQGVWALALANGGSADDIQPGIDYVKKLNDEGIFNKTQVTPATVASGATPIVLDWDYLNVAEGTELAKKGQKWEVNDPADGLVSAYYAQAINRSAPHPAAARLWEEYLYSQDPDGGQNLWLKGYARPIELVAMQKNGSADQAAVAKVPPVTDKNPFVPTQDQVTKATATVTKNWAAAVAG
ncbi:MAG TPA: ABC transporter substrate-binding protein [Nocardioides sp.]|jgi:putative spermidine/putrescine transport system substrate-binding protein|nr:ABC transporter substrate-binding protein [Nocardioides sp.]